MNFKRVLALVLVFAMCLSMIPSYAFADFGEDEYGLIDEADLAAQNETVPEGDVYIDDEPAEEPAVEPVVEPVAEEPEDEQVVDLGELGDADEATFNVTSVAFIGNNGYSTLGAALDAVQEGETILLAKSVTVYEPHTVYVNFTIDAEERRIDIDDGVNGPWLTLKDGATFDGNMTVNGTIAVDGGKLVISEGVFDTVEVVEGGAADLVAGVTGGTFNAIDERLVVAEGYQVKKNGESYQVVEIPATATRTDISYVAYVGEGKDRVLYKTFTAAAAAAGETGIITLINVDSYTAGKGYELAAGKTLKVAKNGHNIKVSSANAAYAVIPSEEDGVTTYVSTAYVAQVGENNKYTTFAAAADAAGGNVITLLTDADAPYTLKSAEETLKVKLDKHALTVDAPVGYAISEATNTEDGVTTYSVGEGVAQIGDKLYASLKAAITAAKAAGTQTTIVLLKDVEEETVAFNGGVDVILDLHGNTLRSGFIYVLNGKAEFKNGTVEGDGYFLYVYGSKDSTVANDFSKLTIASDAIVNGDVVVWGDPTDNTPGNGVELNVNGTVNGCVFVSGNILEGNSVVNVYGTINNTRADIGIALNGFATVNVYDGASISAKDADGNGTGIEVRSGTLNVYGGSITGNGTYSFVPNGNGTSSTGVGVAVAQHTTQKNISVNIKGGEIKGTVAFATANPQENTDGTLTVNIEGGNFTAADGQNAVAVVSEDDRITGFISGGLFSSRPNEDYCAAEYVPVASGSKWTVDTESFQTRVVAVAGAADVEDWSKAGEGYVEADLSLAVAATLSKSDYILVVLNGESVTQHFVDGSTMNVHVVDGGEFIAVPETGVSLKETDVDSLYTTFEASGDEAKVENGGTTTYYATATDALKAANGEGGKVTILKQPAAGTYTMIADAAKTLTIDWNSLDPVITIQSPSASLFYHEKALGDGVIEYSLTGAVAAVDGIAYFETFAEAAAVAALNPSSRRITLYADIEEPFTMEPALATTMTVNHNGHSLTVVPAAGYGLFDNGELAVAATRALGTNNAGEHTYTLQKAYLMSYDPDNGEDVRYETVYAEQNIATPTNVPEKEGYTFIGWFVGNNDMVFGVKPTEDLEIKAKWSLNKYQISLYQYHGAQQVENWTRIVSYGEEITAPEKKLEEREGYSFKGYGTLNAPNLWIGDNEPTYNEITFPFTINSSVLGDVKPIGSDGKVAPENWLNIYGIWDRETYAVSFDGNGGTFTRSGDNHTVESIENVDLNKDEDLVYPTADPVKLGYTFKGWSYDGATATATSLLPKTMPAESRSYVAVWEQNVYDIIYVNTKDISALPETLDLPRTFTIDTLPLTIDALDIPGYKFDGWIAENIQTNPAQTITIPEGTDHTVYVGAIIDLEKYNVTYHNIDGATPVNSNLKPSTYNINNTPLEITNFSKDGYDFIGWKQAGVDGEPKQNLVFGKGTIGDIDLTAVWEIQKVTLGFDTMGGTEVASLRYDYGTNITADPATTTRVGYTFSHWTHLVGNEWKVVEFPFEIKNNETFYANWTPTPYTIAYDMNGAAAKNPTPFTIETDSFKLVQPTRDGYDFAGWTGYNLTEPTKDVTIAKGSIDNRTYTAHWTAKVVDVVIDYNDGGAHKNDTYQVYYGAALTQPTTVEYAGHKLVGWHINDSTETVVFPYNTASKSYVARITLKAEWSLNKHVVTFYANDGTFSGNIDKQTQNGVEYGTDVSYVISTKIGTNDPTREGYEFKGWVLADGSAAPETVTGDLDLYAAWEILPVFVIINYNDGGNTPVDIYKVNVGDDINQPSIPELEGYEFKGWYAMRGNVGAPNDDYPVGVSIIPYITEVIDEFALQIVKATDTNVKPGIPLTEDMLISILKGVDTNKIKEIGTFDGLDTQLDGFALDMHAQFPITLKSFHNFVYLHADWEVEEHNITYHANGGAFADGTNEQLVENVAYGTELTKATPSDLPKWDGYELNKLNPWVLLDGNKAPKTMPAEDLELYANWNEQEYTVTYQLATASDAKIATIINPVSGVEAKDNTYEVTLKFGDTIPAAPDVVVEGYSYEWVEETYGYNAPATMPAENLVFTLKLNGRDYTYTFDADGGLISTYALGYKPEDLSHIDVVSEFNIVVNPATYADKYAALLPQVAPVKEGYEFHGWIDKNGVHYDPEDFGPVSGNTPHFVFEPADKTFTAEWVIKSYNLTFTSNEEGSVLINPNTGLVEENGTYTQAVPFGTSPIPFPAEPTRDGYTFDGWDGTLGKVATVTDIGDHVIVEGKDATHIGRYRYESMPARDINYVALWTADEHSITFNAGDGQFLSADGLVVFDNPYVITGKTDDTFEEGTMPVDPTLDGYTFQYWIDENGKSYGTNTDLAKKLTEIPPEDLVLTAVYKINSNPVVFNGWGGLVLDPKYEEWAPVVITPNVAYGTEIVYPQDPVRKGYTFNGWKDWAYGVTNPETMPDHALYFRADWEAEEHTITFNAGDGEFISSDGLITSADPYVVTAYTDTPIGYLLPVNPTLEGYTFQYWLGDDGNIYNNSDQNFFNDVPVFMVPEDLVLTAIYDLNSVFVTYKPNDGTMIHPTTLIATSSDVTVEYKVGDELIKPAVTLDGYKFGGWVEETYGWNVPETVPDVEPVNDRRTLTLTAFWVGRDYAITFNANGGTVETKALAYNPSEHTDMVPEFTLFFNFEDRDEVQALLPNVQPVRDGHTFHGWKDEAGKHYDAADFGDATTGYKVEAMNKVFTAEWEIDSFTATFDSNFEEVDPVPADGYKWDGKLIDPRTTLPAPSGWYSEEFTFDSEVRYPESIVREGYTFKGWMTTLKAEGTIHPSDEDIGFTSTMKMPGRDVAFEAVWEKNVHTITIEANGGVFTDPVTGIESDSYVIKAEYGTKLKDENKWPAVSTLTNEGYQIKGYTCSNGKNYLPGLTNCEFVNSMPDEDIVLTTVWEAKTIKVTYKLNGNTANPVKATRLDNLLETNDDFTITYKYGDALKLPEVTREGYKLRGWQNVKYGLNIPETVPDYAGGWMDLTAIWEGEDYVMTFDGAGGLVLTTSLRADPAYAQTTDKVPAYTESFKVTELYNAIRGKLPAGLEADGYTFQYWTDEDGVIYTFDYLRSDPFIAAWKAAPKDMVFTAHWNINQKNVRFYGGIGKVVDPFDHEAKDYYDVKVTFGETIPFPDDPELAGYTFKGWKEVNKPYAYDYPTEMPDMNLRFDAQWEVNEYTYTFDANGGIMKSATFDPNSKNPYTVAPGTSVNHRDEFSSYSVTGRYYSYGNPADQVAKPTSIYRDGYTFVGWIDQDGNHYSTGTVPADFRVAKDMVFTAEWTIASYTVKYSTSLGTLTDPITFAPVTSYTFTNVKFGDSIPTIDDPVREGYTFIGWLCTLKANSPVHAADEELGLDSPETMPGRNVEFDAKWEKEVHTITLNGNGGGWKDALGIPYDTFVIKEEYGTDLTGKWPAEDVKREGYELLGWSCNDGKTYKPHLDDADFTATMPAKKIVLTAEWKIKEYQVEFVGNAKGVTLINPLNGKETVTLSAATTIAYNVKYGDLIPYPVVKYDGHDFIAWVEQTHGYNEIDTMPAESLKFFAKWEGLNYSVTFDAAGGIVETKGLSAGPSVSSHKDKVPSYTVVGTPDDDLSNLLPVLPTGNDVNPSRQGYVFDSWVDEDGKHYTNNYLHGLYGNFPAQDKVFTALWTPERHSVKFDPNGGKVVNPKTGVTYTATYTDYVYSDDVITYPIDITRVGYEFIGWQEVGELKLGFAHPETMPAKGVALTFQAQWAPIANTVTYDANGGTLIGPEGYKYGVLTIEAKTGDKIYTPADNPVRYGYTFVGWYDHNNQKVTTLKTTMPAEGETYTARWTPYVITVNFWNGFGLPLHERQFVKFDDYVNKPLDPEYAGHTFEGWYTYNAAQQLLDEFDFSAPLTQFTGTGNDLVLNLVANWSINTYTVSYNANGGLVMGPENFLVNAFSITDLYGAQIHVPAEDPVREGYAFQGWFNESTRKMWASDTDLPSTMPAGDLFLTAVWHVDYFDVVFDANDGHWLGTQTDTKITKITHKVAFTDSIPVPADPVRDGYDFVGWNPVVPETMPGHAMTFKAQWEPAVYRVTFDVNGGMNTIPDQLVAHNGYATEPASYSMYRNGYDFDGWYVKNANGTISTKKYDFKTKVIGNLDLIAKWTGKIVVLRWGDRNVYMNTQIARVGDFIVRPEYNDYYFQQLIRDGRMEGNTRYRLDPDNLWYPEPPEYVEQSLNGMMYTLNWIKQVQIIFLDENGDPITTMYIDEGSTLAQNPDAPNPQKEGYDLLWTVNGKTIDANTPVTASGVATMKATYVEKPVEQTWTVTFNSNGGTEVKTQFIADGENAAEPADPEKDGFKFIGWTLDGETYDFKTPVTGDITLVAEYEEIPYVVGQLSMQLKNNFVLHYYVNDLREGTKPADYTVSFNGGAEQTLTRMDRNAFANVAAFGATQLLDSIPVVVKYQGEVVFEDEISVRAYCDKVFNAYGHDHNVSLVGICEAALNYGSAAQLYVGDDGVLVNYGEWYEYPAEEIPYAEIIKSAPITGITDGTASLQLGSSVSQFLYAYHSRKAKMSDYTFLVNGKEVEVVDTGSAYVARVMQIPVSNLDYENTLTVIYHEGQADQETFSMTASPTAYMYSSYEADSSSTRGQLCYYLYNYYVATTLNDIR